MAVFRSRHKFIRIISGSVCLFLFYLVAVSNNIDNSQNVTSEVVQESEKDVLGIVTCTNGTTTREYLDQTIALFKSVMISAEIYRVPEIEIHRFFENYEQKNETEKVFTDMGYSIEDIDNEHTSGEIKVKLVFHSFDEIKIPKKYQDAMNKHSGKRYRCGYTRFFFPYALPNVDSILYLDSDSLVLGNLMEAWKLLSRFNQSPRKMIGLTLLTKEQENKILPLSKTLKGVPFLRDGYVSAPAWMNLTRMREYRWEERFTRMYLEYSKIVERPLDQTIMNAFLYFDPDLVETLPCNFNYGRNSCLKGAYCKAAEDDPFGVQMLHGYAKFFRYNHGFYRVYEQYLNFPFSRTNFSVETVKTKLMEPIRDWYNDPKVYAGDPKYVGKCKEILGRLLFPNILN